MYCHPRHGDPIARSNNSSLSGDPISWDDLTNEPAQQTRKKDMFNRLSKLEVRESIPDNMCRHPRHGDPIARSNNSSLSGDPILWDDLTNEPAQQTRKKDMFNRLSKIEVRENIPNYMYCHPRNGDLIARSNNGSLSGDPISWDDLTNEPAQQTRKKDMFNRLSKVEVRENIPGITCTVIPGTGISLQEAITAAYPGIPFHGMTQPIGESSQMPLLPFNLAASHSYGVYFITRGPKKGCTVGPLDLASIPTYTEPFGLTASWGEGPRR